MASSPHIAVFSQLRESHERLERLLNDKGGQGFSARSACSQWSVGQVVAHLGSGAEIASEALRSGVAGSIDPLAARTMRGLWAAYDALGDNAAADRAMAANEDLIEAFEALTTTQLADVRIPFFVGPVTVANFAAFRLSEHAVHTWDVEAAGGAAELDVASSAIILESVVKPLIGRLARPVDTAPKQVDVRLTDVGRMLRLTLGDPVALLDDPSIAPADGLLMISTPGFVRLVYGRLNQRRTPEASAVTGSVSIDELRATFPGF